MSHLLARIGSLSLLVTGFLLAVGCGGDSDKKYTVKGKVTLDGKALDGVSIAFYTATGVAAVGNTTSGADGSYEVLFNSKSGDGNYRVTASRWKLKTGAAMPTGEGMDEEQLKLSGAATNTLPEKYATPGTSGISVALQAGVNEKDIPLSAK